MPLLRSRLSLVRTARWRPEYELREEGRSLGRLVWDGAPGTARATIGDRTWALRRGNGRSAIEGELLERELLVLLAGYDLLR